MPAYALDGYDDDPLAHHPALDLRQSYAGNPPPTGAQRAAALASAGQNQADLQARWRAPPPGRRKNSAAVCRRRRRRPAWFLRRPGQCRRVAASFRRFGQVDSRDQQTGGRSHRRPHQPRSTGRAGRVIDAAAAAGLSMFVLAR
jgi:hypothetical protein